MILTILSIAWVCFGRGVVANVKPLHIGVPLNRETYVFGQPPIQYKVEDLVKGRSYEVKVSYPAIIPVRVELSVSADQVPVHSATSRKLLDVEKVIFKVKDASLQTIVILIRAFPSGIPPIGSRASRDRLFYNIVIEENFIGIPLSTVPVILTAMGLVTVTLKRDVFRLFGFPVCMAGIEDMDLRMFVRAVASVQSKKHLTTERHFPIVSIRFQMLTLRPCNERSVRRIQC